MKRIVKEDTEPPAVQKLISLLLDRKFYKYKQLKYGKA